jgi:hypothetical protein
MTPALGTSGIVAAWEAGLARRPLDKAIALLWLAGHADPASLPLAERDRRLLELRQACFGPTLALLADCPACGAALELEVEATGIAASLVAPEPEAVEVGGRRIELRALDSRDLAAAAAVPADDVAGFLRRRLTGEADAPEGLDALIEAREAAGELAFALTCAACGAGWRETLDVPALVWAEVEAAAHRALGEVAELAAAFGWPEADILGLSEVRRRAYLGLARGG